MALDNAIDYTPTQYNIQTGGASNLNNNVAPSATSGVPFISQGASAQPIAGTALVAGGGTGVTSTTAYAVLCGGTTSTGPLQSIASVGTSGQVLTSNGAGALPTFQAAPAGSGYVLRMTSTTSTLSNGVAYYPSTGVGINTYAGGTYLNQAQLRMYCPKAGTITKVYGGFSQTSNGSGETSTIALRLNDTTDTTISSSVVNNSANTTFSNTGLSISVSAGDYIAVKWTTPSWSLAPGGVFISITILVS